MWVIKRRNGENSCSSATNSREPKKAHSERFPLLRMDPDTMIDTRAARPQPPPGFRMGATGTNTSIPATTCYCGEHVQGSDIDHAMTFPKLSGSRSCRHDDWKDALSRVTARAGYSNRVEPGYNEVGTAAPGRAGSRHRGQASSSPWSWPPGCICHTPTSCHRRNRCSYHTRVCSGKT